MPNTIEDFNEGVFALLLWWENLVASFFSYFIFSTNHSNVKCERFTEFVNLAKIVKIRRTAK